VKNKLKYYLKSTFVRYTLSYVIIMMLLLTSIMVVMYKDYQSSIYSYIRDDQTNKLQNIHYQNEGYVRMLSGIANQLGLTAASESFSGESSPAKANELERALNTHMETTDFAAGMYVILNGYDTVYSVDGAISTEEFVNSYEELTSEEFLTVISDTDAPGMIACQNVNGERMVTYTFPLGGNRAGTAIFHVPESNFHMVPEGESAGICNRYILHDGKIVIAGESFSFGREYVLRAANGTGGASENTKLIGGQRYLFISMSGESMDITYFAAIPLNKISRIAANDWVDFVWILLVFAVPCILFMVLISRNNQKIIREMGSRFAKDDDAYADYILAIRTGIKELEGKNRDLDTQLTKSMPARKILFVKSLVKGYFSGAEEAAAAAEQVGLNISRPYFSVLLLGAPGGAHVEIYLDKLLSALPEDVTCAGTDLISHDQMLLVAFADDANRLRAFAQEVYGMESVRAARLPVAVSDIHEDLSQMQTAYLEASSAYDNRFVMGETRLMSFKDMPHAAKSVVPQARGHIEAIKQAMSLGDSDMMNTQLDELVRYLRDTDMSLFAFRLIYNEIIGAIMSVVSERDETDALKYYDLFTLSDCRSLDELDGILRKVLNDVIESGRDENQRPLIQNILAFMTESYTDSAFALSAVAEKFNLTTTRLTLEFKENMRMTPSDYLTMLRMEHSKKLLKQSDLSIKDVCTESGYNDVSSYIRRFKQYTGVTPLQYRQGAKETGEEKKD